MKSDRQNLHRAGKFSDNIGGGGPPVRLSVVAAAGLALIACIFAFFSRQTSPQPTPPVQAPVAGEASTSVGSLPRHNSALSAPKVAYNTDPVALQLPVELPQAQENSTPQFDNELSNPASLRAYLTGGNAALADAVLQAASRQNDGLAARVLLDILRDGAEPKRLDVLQRLCASPYVDEPTRTAALSAALQDSDDALVSHAVRELQNRSDPTAIRLLSEALNQGPLSTRRLILESIVSNTSAESILRQGLEDSDETVRATARASLSLLTTSRTETKE